MLPLGEMAEMVGTGLEGALFVLLLLELPQPGRLKFASRMMETVIASFNRDDIITVTPLMPSQTDARAG